MARFRFIFRHYDPASAQETTYRASAEAGDAAAALAIARKHFEAEVGPIIEPGIVCENPTHANPGQANHDLFAHLNFSRS